MAQIASQVQTSISASTPLSTLYKHSRSRLLKRVTDPDCAGAMGAPSPNEAARKLRKISITPKNMGRLKLKPGGSGALESSPAIARYNPVLGWRGIHLNAQVNWGDPNNTLAERPGGGLQVVRLLDYQAAALGEPSITAGDFMDITILHELAHSFGEVHPDVLKFERNIWTKCLK